MTTWKDIFIRLILFVGLYILANFLFNISFIGVNIFLSLPIVIILIITYCLIIKNLKDKKRLEEFLKADFAAINYTILLERPLTFKEQYENFEANFGPFINGVSIDVLRYKNQMKRHFVVRNEKEHDFELIVTIIQTWRNKLRYRIDNKSRIRN
jgi:hypothetical protein